MNEEALKQLILESPGNISDAVSKQEDPGETIGRLWAMSRSRNHPKQVKKAAKKALYILRSKGVEVDRFQPADEKPERKAPGTVTAQMVSPLVSIPDSGLSSQLLLPVESGDGSFTVYDAVINPDRGILRFNAARGSRRQVERFARETPVFLPVDEQYAVYRFTRAREDTSGSVSGLSGLPAVLTVDPGPVVHPVLDRTRGQFNRIVSAESERALFSRPEIARLSLPDEATAEYREQIESARSSRLIVANMSPQERVKSIIDRFHRTYFTPRKLEYIRNLLLDLALYFVNQGEREPADVLIRYAEGLRAAGTAGASALSKHPFLQFLVYRAFMNQ